jgi:hypothetical protein
MVTAYSFTGHIIVLEKQRIVFMTKDFIPVKEMKFLSLQAAKNHFNMIKIKQKTGPKIHRSLKLEELNFRSYNTMRP